MKVLQVNATYGLGSTGTIVRDLKDCCEANGIECHVAYARTTEKVERGYKIGNWFSNKMHALLSRVAGKQAYFSYLPTLRFIRHMKQLQPDVVHLHNLHANYINLPMLLKHLADNDVRTIITLHDCWWYTGGCFHYTAAGCNKWLDKCGNCPKRTADAPAYLYDRSAKILEDKKQLLLAIPRLTVIGVSEWISNEARKSFLASKEIKTIRNGIDLTVFKPTPSDLRERLGLEGKYVILGPASKWLDPINKEVLDYFATNMKPDEVLLLFGAESTKTALPANVKLYGYTYDKHELASLYTMADVFVNCTREDTLPTINLEAQACGCRVITFGVCGASETVDGLYSHYVKISSPDLLYEFANVDVEIDKAMLRMYMCGTFSKDNYHTYIEVFAKSLKE